MILEDSIKGVVYTAKVVVVVVVVNHPNQP